MNDNELEILRGNGYVAGVFQIEDSPQLQLIAAQQDYYFTDSAAFAADQRTCLRDPTITVAVLEFSVEEASPFSTRFATDLLKLIAPPDRLLRKYIRPLVRVSPTSVHAIYQSDMAPFLRDEFLRP